MTFPPLQPPHLSSLTSVFPLSPFSIFSWWQCSMFGGCVVITSCADSKIDICLLKNSLKQYRHLWSKMFKILGIILLLVSSIPEVLSVYVELESEESVYLLLHSYMANVAIVSIVSHHPSDSAVWCPTQNENPWIAVVAFYILPHCLHTWFPKFYFPSPLSCSILAYHVWSMTFDLCHVCLMIHLILLCSLQNPVMLMCII